MIYKYIMKHGKKRKKETLGRFWIKQKILGANKRYVQDYFSRKIVLNKIVYNLVVTAHTCKHIVIAVNL